MVDFEEVREDDGSGDWGSVMAFDVKGRVEVDEVEMFLAREAEEYEQFNEGVRGGWNITHVWRRKIPCDYGSRYQYQGAPARGATAVTHVEPDQSWQRWCLNHPFEPASTGVPSSSVIDGERIVRERLAALDKQIDPRKDVDVDPSSRGYIYLCRECSMAFHDRQKEAMVVATGTGGVQTQQQTQIDAWRSSGIGR